MTVQKFIYNNAGLTNENNLEDKPSICGLCNTYSEKTISSKKIFSGNFTNYEYFKNDRLCEHCVNLIKNSKSEDMRRSSFITTEQGNDYFKNSDLYKKLFQEKQIPFNGNYPKKPEYKRKIKQSGFMEYLSKKTPDGIALNTMNSAIYTHGKNRVLSSVASQLIETSSYTVWGEARRCPGVMNTFTELMANTYKHASSEEGKHHWWVSVTKDKVNQKVTFSFVDYGVGIFRSLKNKKADDQLYNALEKLWNKFPWADNDAKMMKLSCKENFTKL